jgi:2-C-methyl-D-erythritol 4-phosphate cytidylyltransferase
MTTSSSPPRGLARCFALVPCAGIGERAGQGLPKQYAHLNGQPLVRHTLRALRQCPALTATLVVISPGDTHFTNCVPADEHSRDWLLAAGGATRAASVANGLQGLRERGAGDDDWVLVHDAARCLLRPEWVLRLIDVCAADAVGGLLALPLADTIKREAEHSTGRAQTTVPRQGLWAAQTPQMFRLGLLRRALAAAGDGVTDEASAIEALGLRPLLVPGDWENLKLTWPADFALAERLLSTR